MQDQQDFLSVQEAAKAMAVVAKKTQDAIDTALQAADNGRRRGPGRPPGPRVLDHMTSPSHTTSYCFMVSVPMSEAIMANAHLAYLLDVYRDLSKSEIVLKALKDLAISCGFEYDPNDAITGK